MTDERPDLSVYQERADRLITALLIEANGGDENSVRWGGPTVADLVREDEREVFELMKQRQGDWGAALETMFRELPSIADMATDFDTTVPVDAKTFTFRVMDTTSPSRTKDVLGCNPPEHFWHFVRPGRVTCACGETTATLTTDESGWEIRLSDGRSLWKRVGSQVDVGDEVAFRTAVRPDLPAGPS